ncbi:MAG: response regulator [Alphaproteobacteria bacterium]|nr:response regulator [Alphaproteobacteria bacterium]
MIPKIFSSIGSRLSLVIVIMLVGFAVIAGSAVRVFGQMEKASERKSQLFEQSQVIGHFHEAVLKSVNLIDQLIFDNDASVIPELLAINEDILGQFAQFQANAETFGLVNDGYLATEHEPVVFQLRNDFYRIVSLYRQQEFEEAATVRRRILILHLKILRTFILNAEELRDFDIADQTTRIAALKKNLIVYSLAIFMVVVLISLILTFAVHRSITRPLSVLTRAVQEFKLTDTDSDVSYDTMKLPNDEIGVLGKSFMQLTGNLRTYITERKQTEEVLRERDVQIEQALKLAHMGTWVWDDTIVEFEYVSPQFAEIFGYDVDQFLKLSKKSESYLFCIHPDDVDSHVRDLKEGVRRKERWQVEYRIIRKDGAVRNLLEIAQPVFGPDGTMLKSIGCTQDITEYTEAQNQLRQAQRMEAIGQLTGGIAHDFNNLLAVMIGNSELLEDRIGEDESARNQLEAIQRAVDRASSLTDRLLAFSRKQALSPVATDIPDLIVGLAELLRRTLGETIDLRAETSSDLWPAMIDPHQFENALVNLSLNARDAMPKGGTLVIETANVTLDEIYAEQFDEVTPGDYVMVAVSDTGTGISPEVLKKVFEPFFTTKDVGKGSGLGLSMVYGFAKQSNGHITIYSEEGHGTTAKLYVPRSEKTLAEGDTKDDTPEIARGSERILVIEDNESVREIPVTILRDQGYNVVEAGDGQEAIKHLKDGPPIDLLFTDVVLPGGMNGIEIAEQAKELKPNIKVLYTTGYADSAIVHHGKLDSGVTLVTKPYRRADLLEKIRAVLDREDD